MVVRLLQLRVWVLGLLSKMGIWAAVGVGGRVGEGGWEVHAEDHAAVRRCGERRRRNCEAVQRMKLTWRVNDATGLNRGATEVAEDDAEVEHEPSFSTGDIFISWFVLGQ